MALNPFLKKIRRKLPQLEEVEVISNLEALTVEELLLHNTGEKPLFWSPPNSYHLRREFSSLEPARNRRSKPCSKPVLPPALLKDSALKSRAFVIEQLLSAYAHWQVEVSIEALRLDSRGLEALVVPLHAYVGQHCKQSVSLRENLYSQAPATQTEVLSPAMLVYDINQVFPNVSLPAPALALPSSLAKIFLLMYEYMVETNPESACVELLNQNLTQEVLEQFQGRLDAVFSDYYPMCVHLLDDVIDLAGDQEELNNLGDTAFYLPMLNIEDGSAITDTELAFLEGPASIAALLADKHKSADFTLQAEDQALVETVGWSVLVDRFVLSQDAEDPHWNILKLQNHWDFFTPLFEKYPQQHNDLSTHIAGGSYPEFDIRSVEDIRFCTEYHETFWRLMSMIPVLTEDYDGGAGEELNDFIDAVLSTSRVSRSSPAVTEENIHEAA